MSTHDKKLAILKALGQEVAPMGLAELLRRLGTQYSDRSVRRWLNELVRDGLVERHGQKRATKYLLIKPERGSLSEERGIFSVVSLQAIQQIRRPIFDRLPVPYDSSWLDSYRPNSTFYICEEIRAQLWQAGRRANDQDPAGTYAHRIFNRLLIDLSYNSSRLEGNTYSLLDTERLLLHGKGVEGKLEEERVMILNHKEAIRYLVDNAPKLDPTRNVICTLHYLLADGLVEAAYAGKVRDYGVRIGGSTYIPLEGSKRLQQQLEAIATKAVAIRDPFEQSCFLLTHVSYLQAFADVNKRTARLSANIPLVKGNLVPLAFNDVKVEDYMSVMIAIYELKDVRPLVDLYAHSYLRTCVAYDATIRALGFDEVRVRYRRQRRDMVRDVLEQGLTGDAMQKAIKTTAQAQIPEIDRQAFVDDVLEDLEQIDEARLVGLGITVDQMLQWKRLQHHDE